MRAPHSPLQASSEGDPPAPIPGGDVRLLLVVDPGAEGAAAMLRGVAHHQQQFGGRSVLADELPRTPEDSRRLLAQGWDGAVSRGASTSFVAACAEVGVPLFALDDIPLPPGVSRILPDDGAIGARGAEFLLDRGFRQLAFVGGNDSGRTRGRTAGFVEAARLGGHAVTVLPPPAGAGSSSGAGDGEFERWLREVPKPAGVMAGDDRCAIRVLECARAAGCPVPEDLAVLGAGNEVARCELATPPLSSVDPGWFECGYKAAEQLAQRLRHPATAPGALRLDPAAIVTRRSTDVLAIRDPIVAAAVRHIAAHACEGLKVDEVLPRVAVSRAQLEKKFRRHLGRSPQAEIRRVQLARIRQLLTDTDLPLKHIAARAGFAYTEYLCVVFRRLTGETPGAYRRRHSRYGAANGDRAPRPPGKGNQSV